MAAPQTFVIAGASLAGAKAAETLRGEGFEGRVVLVGEEPVRPYERPPLSKAYLRGEVDFDTAAVHPQAFYTDHNIELLTSTTVTSVDPAAKQVSLNPGGVLDYDRLLLATGATLRHLAIPGAGLDGIRYLRSLSSRDALREALGRATRLVVVGAGWIGSEVAASARQLGKEVALIEVAQVPSNACWVRRSAPCSAICMPSTVWSCTWVSAWRLSGVRPRPRKWSWLTAPRCGGTCSWWGWV